MLAFAVERLRDGAFHMASPAPRWSRPTPGAYARMRESEAGRYDASLPELDPSHDYCLHVIDAANQQLVISQLFDGGGAKIETPAVGGRRGRPAPANRYHGGFVAVDIREGRAVELE